ncbi:prostaglandin E synthase-like [Prorops nasuta]|uniref:prostaglandin E synthase-like n=1 Tax=Prorops nasuta TaxID=863751 RepID=UPI0034CE5444
MVTTMQVMQQELWSIYSWWGCVLVVKMLTLIWFTGRIRVRKQVIHSEEDRMWFKGSDNITLCPSGGGDPEVDRIRSAHRVDLEIVLPYLLIAPIYLYFETNLPLARLLMPIFATTSIFYTLSHMDIIPVKAGSKTALYMIKLLVPVYMCAVCMINCLK